MRMQFKVMVNNLSYYMYIITHAMCVQQECTRFSTMCPWRLVEEVVVNWYAEKGACICSIRVSAISAAPCRRTVVY